VIRAIRERAVAERFRQDVGEHQPSDVRRGHRYTRRRMRETLRILSGPRDPPVGGAASRTVPEEAEALPSRPAADLDQEDSEPRSAATAACASSGRRGCELSAAPKATTFTSRIAGARSGDVLEPSIRHRGNRDSRERDRRGGLPGTEAPPPPAASHGWRPAPRPCAGTDEGRGVIARAAGPGNGPMRRRIGDRLQLEASVGRPPPGRTFRSGRPLRKTERDAVLCRAEAEGSNTNRDAGRAEVVRGRRARVRRNSGGEDEEKVVLRARLPTAPGGRRPSRLCPESWISRSSVGPG
jgi:hypothetical protein